MKVSYKQALKKPEGGYSQMDASGMLATLSETLGRKFAMNPEGIYNWAVKFNITYERLRDIFTNILSGMDKKKYDALNHFVEAVVWERQLNMEDILMEQDTKLNEIMGIINEITPINEELNSETEVGENKMDSYAKYDVAWYNQNIDFGPLNKKLSDLLGIPINIQADSFDKGKYLFASHNKEENLVKHSGIFKSVFNGAILCSYGNSLTKNAEDGTVRWWASWHLSYSHIEGGSNGAELMTSWYNFDTKKWVFRVNGVETRM